MFSRAARLAHCSNSLHVTHTLFTLLPVRVQRHMATWQSATMHPKTKSAIAQEFGYSDMSEVQEHVLEKSKNQDLLVRAKTGTGKTLAFLVAALESCLADDAFGKSKIPILIISPTRELAQQIQAEAVRLVRNHRLTVRLAVGGTPRRKLVSDLTYGPTDILVGTPGRLNDILSDIPDLQRKVSGLKVLIFDEADQLLDMGFKKEMVQIASYLGNDRRTFLFSATLSPEIRKIAKQMLKSGYSDIDTVPKNEVSHSAIKQSVLVAPYKQHFSLMHQILKGHQTSTENSKVIVFFQTTLMVELMKSVFSLLGFDIMHLHAKLEQRVRTRTSANFRAARSAILFTTDVSARGVDYPNVTLVLSHGMPPSRDQYIHRIGRTGRAGKDGEALLLLSPFEKRFMESMRDIPVRDELRYNPSLHDPAFDAQISNALTKIGASDIRGAIMAQLGFHVNKVDVSLISKQTVVLCVRDMAIQCFGLPELPRLSSRLAQNMGLTNVAGIEIIRGGEGRRGDDNSQGGYGGQRSQGGFDGQRSQGGFDGQRSQGGYGSQRTQGGYGGQRSQGGSDGGYKRQGGYGQREHSGNDTFISGNARKIFDKKLGNPRGQKDFGGFVTHPKAPWSQKSESGSSRW